MEKDETHIAIFHGKTIRIKLVENKWFFSVVDIVGILTDSEDSRKYWNKLSQRLREEGSELVTFCHRLKLKSGDGKEYETDCADTEGIFRIIQLTNLIKILTEFKLSHFYFQEQLALHSCPIKFEAFQ